MRCWLRSLTCLVLLAGTGHAQAIRGRVLLADGSAPSPGILILGVDGAGNTVARALSSPGGAYYLQLPKAGVYDVRAIRIGYRPGSPQRVTIAGAEVKALDLHIDRLPVELSAVRVLGGDDCLPDCDDAIRFLMLVEQARKALANEHLAQREVPTEYRLVRMRGVVDRKGVRADGDSVRYEELLLDRPFELTPVDSLLRVGYVRFDQTGRVRYDVPNPDLLMSEDFLASHCFRLVKGPREYRTWTGVAFWPAMVRDSMADIDGTIWLDGPTGELRRFDFGYMNLRELRATLCRRPVPNTPTWRFCTDRSSLAFATGGYLSFRRMDSGEWVVNELVLRTPEQRDPRDTTKRSATSSALTTTHVTVASVKQAGQIVYWDDGLLPAGTPSPAGRAGRRPAALDGLVVDSSGSAIANAVVQIIEPVRVAVTDSVGHFRSEERRVGQ